MLVLEHIVQLLFSGCCYIDIGETQTLEASAVSPNSDIILVSVASF